MTKVWVLLHTSGYSFDNVNVVSVHTSKESADNALMNHIDSGNCSVEESYLED